MLETLLSFRLILYWTTLPLVLRLKQCQRADVAGVAFGGLGQPRPCLDGVMHGGTPVGMLGEHDRQLNHFSGLHLGGGGAEQDIATASRVVAGRRGELNDAGRFERGQHLKGKIRARLVRLVHDDQRTVKRHEVDEGKLQTAVLGAFQAWRRGWNVREVRFVVFRVGVGLAPGGVTGAEALNRSDNNGHSLRQVLRPDLANLGHIEHRHAPVIGGVERSAIGMRRLLECFGGLHADGVGRHHPQHHGVVALKEVTASHGNSM